MKFGAKSNRGRIRSTFGKVVYILQSAVCSALPDVSRDVGNCSENNGSQFIWMPAKAGIGGLKPASTKDWTTGQEMEETMPRAVSGR